METAQAVKIAIVALKREAKQYNQTVEGQKEKKEHMEAIETLKNLKYTE